MYVGKSLTPIELGLNLNFKKFVPWKLKSAAPNELKTSRSMFYGRRDRKNQKRRFDWFYIILKHS